MLSALSCIVAGSMLGGVVRYFVSGMIARRLGETFPWGTMAVNASGALLIGTFARLATENASILASPNPWLFAVTGFLGCYTTVSSFSLQTLTLARDGEALRAAGNVALSVSLCLAAVSCGYIVTGHFV
jgi:fluoride exporter